MDRSEFYKKIELGIELNKNDIKSVESSLEALGEKVFSKDEQKKIIKDLEEVGKKELVIQKIQKDLTIAKKTGNAKLIKTLERELQGLDSQYSKLDPEKLQSSLEDLSKKFLDKLGEVFKDAWEELENMLSYSLMTDSSIRNLKLQYGFSSAQAYGYDTAMKVMGFGSMEDLMYANEEQMRLFNEAFQKYSNRYDELYDSGFFDTLLKYQVEMEEFKTDMQQEVIEFFVNNKDLIKTGMIALMELSKIALSILSFLVEWFGDGRRSEDQKLRETNSILSNYTSNSSTTNINQTNNFNGDISDASMAANVAKMANYNLLESVKNL